MSTICRCIIKRVRRQQMFGWLRNVVFLKYLLGFFPRWKIEECYPDENYNNLYETWGKDKYKCAYVHTYIFNVCTHKCTYLYLYQNPIVNSHNDELNFYIINNKNIKSVLLMFLKIVKEIL